MVDNAQPPLALPPDAFARADETPDELFYALPRLVYHIDDGAVAAVTQLYREYLPDNAAVLDLMSSWVSHLPPERRYRRVVGLGMNAEELAANPRLDDYRVHNLNADPRLPFDAASFDAALICVSIDYLVEPVAVLRELGRVLRAGAPLVITFSNRCFPTKAIALWHQLSAAGRQQLIAYWLEQAGCWQSIKLEDRSPPPGQGDPLYGVIGYVSE